MIRTITKKFDKITWKIWLFFLLISQTIYLIMVTQTISRIGRAAGGLQIFDMHPFGYTYDYAYNFLSVLSSQGYDLYKYVQLPLDILYPLVNSLAGICTLILLIRVYHKVKHNAGQVKYSLPFKIMFSLPIAALLFDYLENITIFITLTYKNSVPKAHITVSSIFTVIKSMSTTVFYTACLVICIVISVIWLHTKIKGGAHN